MSAEAAHSELRSASTVFRIVAFTFVALAAASCDDPSPDVATCDHGQGVERLDACTRLIDSGSYEGNRLSGFYLNRGIARSDAQQWDDAIVDFTSAIAADPENAKAWAIGALT